MNPEQLREWVIRPTLKYLEPEIPYSESAEDLLMMTAAHESRLGTYLRQVGVEDGKGAYGIYQIEKATEDDVFDNFLHFRKGLYFKVDSMLEVYIPETEPLVTDLAYATAIARLIYYRDKEPLPVRKKYATQDDYLFALAQFAKRVFNTYKGKAEVSDYFLAYKELVLNNA